MTSKPERGTSKRRRFLQERVDTLRVVVPIQDEEERETILTLSPEERRARLLGEGKEDASHNQ